MKKKTDLEKHSANSLIPIKFKYNISISYKTLKKTEIHSKN